MGKTLLLLLALAVAPGFGWSQRPAPPPTEDSPNAQQPDQQPSPDQPSKVAEGEFTKIDKQKQTLWIKTSEGEEMQFTYTDQTPILNAKGPVQVGSRLKVYYADGGDTMAALRIEVESEPG